MCEGNKRMRVRDRVLAAVLPAMLLAGCGGTVNRGLESVHQPVVQRTDYAFDVATDGGAVSAAEIQRLAGWMNSMRVGYGDRIAIDDEAGGVTPSVREAIAGEAARFGLLVSDDAPAPTAPLTPGTVRVVLSRMSAGVPGCPDHSRVSGLDYNANTWSNYGCGVNSNLAAMVARPEDLVLGQTGANTADTATNFRAIDTYRKAKPTGAEGLKSERTRSGN
jgi:pilus assembly protein CpaD